MPAKPSPTAVFAAALSSATVPDAPFAALHELCSATVGARLFTVTTVEQGGMLARRTYTSDPISYPVSGTKRVEPNDWTDQVLVARQIFVANTLAEIATVFPDHELIGALGLGSVINIPLVLADEIVATLNLLDVAGYYTARRTALAIDMLTLPGLAAQMAHDRLLAALETV